MDQVTHKRYKMEFKSRVTLEVIEGDGGDLLRKGGA